MFSLSHALFVFSVPASRVLLSLSPVPVPVPGPGRRRRLLCFPPVDRPTARTGTKRDLSVYAEATNPV